MAVVSVKKPVILLSIGHACVDVYQGAVTALVPFFIAERAYSYAAAAGVVLAASLLSSVAQPLFGALTDRRRLPWLLPVSTITGGIGIAASGLTQSYAWTLAFVAVSGIGVAAYHPESARVARIAAGGGHTAMSWFSLGGNLGFAAAPLLVTAVVAPGGLRYTPLLALPALAGAALCLPVLRTLAARATTGRSATASARGDDWRSFARLSLAITGRSIVFVGLGTFIASYARQQVGGPVGAGTAALFVLYLGGAVGTIAGGRLAERFDRVTVVRVSYLVTAVAVAGVVLVPGPAIYGFTAVTAAGLYVPFSLQVTLGQDYLPGRIGTASGVTLGLTVTIGGLASPVVGAIADASSLKTALAPLIVLPLLSWLAIRRLPEPAVALAPAGPKPGFAG